MIRCIHSKCKHNMLLLLPFLQPYESKATARWSAEPDSSSLSTPPSLNVIYTAVSLHPLPPRSSCSSMAAKSWETIASCVLFPVICPSLLLLRRLTSFSINYTKTMILAKDGLPRRFWSHLNRSLISVMKSEQ